MFTIAISKMVLCSMFGLRIRAPFPRCKDKSGPLRLTAALLQELQPLTGRDRTIIAMEKNEKVDSGRKL